jgi:threonine/homoserine/homoserine lactone efflux protein
MEPVVRGVYFGVVLAFLIGPVFFALLQTGMERGFLAGMLVATGVALSDAMYLMLSFMGLSALLENRSFHTYLGVGGGVLLGAFGVYYIFLKRKISVGARAIHEQRTSAHYLVKGFLLNTMSPMVPLFWMGTVSLATADFGYVRMSQFLPFFAGVLSTTWLTDIGKSWMAVRVSKLITPSRLHWANRVIGGILLAFGARLVWYTLWRH